MTADTSSTAITRTLVIELLEWAPEDLHSILLQSDCQSDSVVLPRWSDMSSIHIPFRPFTTKSDWRFRGRPGVLMAYRGPLSSHECPGRSPNFRLRGDVSGPHASVKLETPEALPHYSAWCQPGNLFPFCILISLLLEFEILSFLRDS